MSSFLSRWRQQFSSQLSVTSDTSSSLHLSVGADVTTDGPDTEDEGYLLVNAPDGGMIPPTPSTRALSFGQSFQDGQITSQLSTTINIPSDNPADPNLYLDSPLTCNQQSVVSDIPFKFHVLLEVPLQIKAALHDISLEQQVFDWSKHSYNFKNEQQFLRDMGTLEEADSEYSQLPDSWTQTPTSVCLSHDKEIDLIKL